MHLLAATLLLATETLAAGSAAQRGLEEIVVTASRRDTNLLDTAASITSFNAQTRDTLGIQTSEDLAAHAPSLSISQFRVSIRGVGRPTLALGSDPGVGIYWDDVYQTQNAVLNYSNMFDIDRVEVLRGPQGTLYGRNSIGGAIKLLSKQPTNNWTGKIVGEYGNYNYRVMQGMVAGPVTEKFGILAALSSINRDGFTENLYNGEHYDEANHDYANLILRYDWMDSWRTTLKTHYYRVNYHPANGGYRRDPYDTAYIQTVDDQATGETLNFPGMFPGQNFVNPQQGYQRPNPGVTSDQEYLIDHAPTVDSTFPALILTNDVFLEKLQIRYIAAASRYKFNNSQDADNSVAAYSGLDWSRLFVGNIPVSVLTGQTLTPSYMVSEVEQNARFGSHELQFISTLGGKVEFVSGLYYYSGHEEQNLDFTEFNNDLMDVYRFFGVQREMPVSSGNALFDGSSVLDTKAYAAYGQADWTFVPRWTLTAGLRYSLDEKSGSDSTFVQYVGTGDGVINRKAKDSWRKLTWRLGLDYSLTDTSLLYGFAATGYRSGGFNLIKPTDSPEVDSVDPEDLLSFEVGYKASYNRNRVILSTAAFYYDYKDLQLRQEEVVNGVSVSSLENADDARLWGIELELTTLLGDHFTLSGNYSYNNSSLGDYYSVDANACLLGPLLVGDSEAPLCSQAQNLKGNKIPMTPEQQFSLNGVWDWDMLGLEWQAVLSYMYTGAQYMTTFNTREYDHIAAWDRWDARFGFGQQRWTLTAWVQNISDERQILARNRPNTINHLAAATLTDPRTFGLRFEYRFD